MNLQKMIVELQAERERLDDAIMALERLATSNRKRRGRPPRWLKDYKGEHAPEQAPDLKGKTPEEPSS